MGKTAKRRTRYVACLLAAIFPLFVESGCVDVTSYANEVGPGVTFLSYVGSAGRYHEVHVDLELARCTFHWQDDSDEPLKTIDALRAHLRTKDIEPLFITNGGIYQPNLTPGGLYVEHGQTLHPLNLKDGKGNFHLKPNGVFALKDQKAYIIDAAEYEAADIQPDYAIQSGPLLVKEGEIHPAFNPESENRYIRSGVGIYPDGSVLFALSDKPVTFHEFATFFQNERGIQNALYLDGAISTFTYRDGPKPPQPADYASMIVVSER